MSCLHPRITPLGTRLHFGEPCPTTGVPLGSYLVHQCASCRARIDVCTETGKRYVYHTETLRPYDNPGPVAGSGQSRREVYTPQYDGVAAAPDTRKPWGTDFRGVWS